MVGAKAVIPVHAGKFNLCKSPWKMPFERITKAYEDNGYSYKLLLPEIGELVAIPSDKEYPQWWIDI